MTSGGKRRFTRPEKRPSWSLDWGKCPATGKRSFPRVGDVKIAARAAGLRYYKCAHCGDYHLTSQPATLQKAYKLLTGKPE